MKRCMVLFMIICSFMGCEENYMDTEYESLKQSGLGGQDLLMALTNFELNNASHFASKVDLGSYYVLAGDYEKAREYLRRAEGVVKNAPKNAEGEKSVCILYGLLAQVELYMAYFAEAEVYAQMAVDSHSEYGEEYYYVLGQSQLAQEKKEEALQTFDIVFATLPEKANTEDLRGYMYLLADAELFTDCVPIMERYFETGEYFSGLGLFASSVYEKEGETEKSILSAFLDYEFNSNYNGYEYEAFMNNLDNLETILQSNGTATIGVPVIQLIRSIYDDDIVVLDSFSSFFVARYCVLTRRTMDGTLVFDDFMEYLSLEKYFKKFPVYYWNTWNMVKMLDAAELPKYTILLEKIIALQPDEFFTTNAKYELGELIGLDESASESILTEQELQLIVFEYAQTGNHKLFDKIYSLLELPDNSYVIQAMQFLKYNREQYFLEDILRVKQQTTDGRLQERIEYILQ